MKITKIKRRIHDPIIPTPRYYTDPTRQGANRAQAFRVQNQRFNNIKRAISRLIESLPSTRKVVNRVIYEYQVDSRTYQSTTLWLQQLLYDELLDSPE